MSVSKFPGISFAVILGSAAILVSVLRNIANAILEAKSLIDWFWGTMFDPLFWCGIGMVSVVAIFYWEDVSRFFQTKRHLLRLLSDRAKDGDELFMRPNVGDDLRSYRQWTGDVSAWKKSVIEILDHHKLWGEEANLETDLPDDDEFKRYDSEEIVSRHKNLIKARLNTIRDIIKRHS